MALVVFISSFLITSTVHDTMANETAVDMNCWCNSIGFKTVNIIWEPLPQEPNLFFESVYYRVFFCTYESHRCDIDITNRKQGVHYHLGCTLNTSANLQSVSQQSKLKCSISRTGDTLFDPHGFHFIVEMRNSSGVFISRKKTCRLASNVECAKPQNVKVIAKGKRNLSISWIPSWEMERYAQFLCYRIWYSSSQAKSNESIEMKSHPGKLLTYTIRDLSPHTKYTLFIQCGLLNCLNGWGPLSGPLFVLTDEEVPDKAPEFENNNFFNISNNDDKKRDESVFWKLPPMNTWNGVLRKFEIYYRQLPSKENFSNVNSVSNRSRMLQINSGSAKEATLIGLSRFDDYEAKISMCNSQGCGPNSGPLVLRGDNERKKSKWGAATSKSLHNNSFVKIAVGASIIAVVLSIIVCVVIYKFRESRRRRKTPLNKLWNSRDLNPDDVEDVEEIEPVPSNANSYDLIGVPRIPNKSIPLLDELQMEQGSSEVDA